MIPAEAAEAINVSCKIEMIDMEELAEETRKIGYPVLPLVKQVVRLANSINQDLENGLIGGYHAGVSHEPNYFRRLELNW